MAKKPKNIDAYDHEAARLNTPTAELSGIAEAMEGDGAYDACVLHAGISSGGRGDAGARYGF